MKNTVTQEQVDKIFNDSTKIVEKMGDKTTVFCCNLANGFAIVESSSCVDPVNYNSDRGQENCEKRIKDKIWELEGYLLQSKLCEI